MSEQDPSQGSLFEIQETTKPAVTTDPGNYKPRVETTITPSLEGVYTEVNQDAVSEGVGPSIDILDRNKTLVRAIGKVASISRAEGFSKAHQIPSERDRISDRYADRHEEVVDNTANKSKRDAEAVPENFAKVWGLDEVVSAGLLSEQKAEDEMAKDYRRFESWYGGSGPGADRRDTKKKWLNYQQRIYTDQRTRKPKAPYPRHPHSS